MGSTTTYILTLLIILLCSTANGQNTVGENATATQPAQSPCLTEDFALQSRDSDSDVKSFFDGPMQKTRLQLLALIAAGKPLTDLEATILPSCSLKAVATTNAKLAFVGHKGLSNDTVKFLPVSAATGQPMSRPLVCLKSTGEVSEGDFVKFPLMAGALLDIVLVVGGADNCGQGPHIHGCSSLNPKQRRRSVVAIVPGSDWILIGFETGPLNEADYTDVVLAINIGAQNTATILLNR